MTPPRLPRRTDAGPIGITLITAVLWLTAPAPLRGAGPDVTAEYRIKAAYLFNFTKFIEWPPQSVRSSDEPLVIAVIDGDGTAFKAMQDVLRGKRTSSGRPLDLRFFDQLDPAALDAHIVFVMRDAKVSADTVKTAVGKRPILVVGESEGFAERGGTINFVVSGDVVRFEINPRRAEAAGLRVSGSLAAVARLVRDRETN